MRAIYKGFWQNMFCIFTFVNIFYHFSFFYFCLSLNLCWCYIFHINAFHLFDIIQPIQLIYSLQSWLKPTRPTHPPPDYIFTSNYESIINVIKQSISINVFYFLFLSFLCLSFDMDGSLELLVIQQNRWVHAIWCLHELYMYGILL